MIQRPLSWFVCALVGYCLPVLAEYSGTPLLKVRIGHGTVIPVAESVGASAYGGSIHETGDYPCTDPGEGNALGPPLPPDLSGSVTVTDGVGPGIMYDYTISNGGDMGASNFHVYIVLSTNTDILTSDILIGDYIHSIDGKHSTSYTSKTADVALVEPGTYYLGIIVDATGIITESNEDNNVNYDPSLQITVDPWCDLAGSVTVIDGTGPDISYQFALQNNGNIPTSIFQVYIMLSKNTTISPTEDILLGTYNIMLSAGNMYTSQTYSKHINNVDPDTYYLGIYIDATYLISETNENNNSNYDHSQQIDMSNFPDLVATIEVVSISDPSAFTYSYTLLNKGGVTANDFNVAILLSTDETIRTNDNLIASHHFNYLSSMNLYSSGNQQVNIAAVPAGTYYLGLYADATLTVYESNETNNTDCDTKPQVVIEALPDLLVQSIDVLDGAGTEISYQCTVKNGGNTNAGKFSVKFYLSLDTDVNSSDYIIDTWPVNGILASGSTKGSGGRTTTVSGVPAGDYYLGAVVDEADEVAESISSNNSGYDDAPLVTITETSERFWADLDGDGDVDIADVQMVAGLWGSQTGDGNYLAICDVDGDGDIDIVDVQMVAGAWGTVI